MCEQQGTGLVLFGTGRLLAVSVFIVRIKQVSLNCSKPIFQLRLYKDLHLHPKMWPRGTMQEGKHRAWPIYLSLEVSRVHFDPGNRNEQPVYSCLKTFNMSAHQQTINSCSSRSLAYVALELCSASKGFLAKLL